MGKIVITIDGGGIRGIVPASILMFMEEYIQNRYNKPSYRISESIDFIGGTSTGSIVASLIGSPKRFTMKEILDLYCDLGPSVFKKSFWHRIKTLWGLLGPVFPPSNIMPFLNEMYGEMKMEDLIMPSLFTAYDIDKRRINIFTNRDTNRKYSKYLVKDIIRGSTSIPAYFPPAHFRVDGDENTLVDGGVFANNPALITLTELRKTKDLGLPLHLGEILFISFGTGEAKLKKFQYSKVKGWGVTRWLFPVLDVLLSSSKESVDYQMRGIFSSYTIDDNYIRIDPPLKKTTKPPTDASEENINNLLEDSINYIKENQNQLASLAERIYLKNLTV